MDVLKETQSILEEALNLNGDSAAFTRDTVLFGAIQELDSMGVVAVIAMIEARFGFPVGYDEIDATTFQTVGTLADFIEHKVRHHAQEGNRAAGHSTESSPLALHVLLGLPVNTGLETDGFQLAIANMCENWTFLATKVAELA